VCVCVQLGNRFVRKQHIFSRFHNCT
jgi:hypothetical protein